MEWNWIRLDLDEGTSTIGDGYPTRLDATAPMRPQIEALVDLFPDRQPAAHQWLAGYDETDTLTIRRFIYGLYQFDGTAADRDVEAKLWVTTYVGRPSG